MVRIAIDIGGTFIDLVFEMTEGLVVTKVLTTPENPEHATLDGIDEVLDGLSLGLTDVVTMVHGTTLATNALIEQRDAKTACVAFEGFRDVLETNNEKSFDQCALNFRLPDALVRRSLRLTLNERILSDCSILAPLNEAEIAALSNTLRRESVEAVAIGFLHSYRNSIHEKLVADLLREPLGNAVTGFLSAEVAGEICEFERLSQPTTTRL